MEQEQDSRFPVLRFFACEDLPARHQAMGKRFAELAWEMARASNLPAETAAGLRKLLEARDCAMRASLR